jgi:hypothetical protein
MAYCKYAGDKFEPKQDGNSYRFGADKQESLGSIKICFPAMRVPVELNVDVIGADVPFLVGLDTMDALAITTDTVLNVLKCPKEGWSIPLVRKHGHVFLEWQKGIDVYFTKDELKKMHRSFCHPPNQSLLNLIKKGKPEELVSNTLQVLEEISKACQVCQRQGPKPVRF